MPETLVFLYWPDFLPAPETVARISPALVAHRLHRRLRLLAEGAQVWAWPGVDAEATEAFRRWGFHLLEEPLAAEAVAALVAEAALSSEAPAAAHSTAEPEARRVVLAMGRARAGELLPLLAAAGREVQLWLPASEPTEGSPAGEPLETALGLETAWPAAVLIDGARLAAAARTLPGAPSPERLCRRLLQCADLMGDLVAALLVPPWEPTGPIDLSGPPPVASASGGGALRSLRQFSVALDSRSRLPAAPDGDGRGRPVGPEPAGETDGALLRALEKLLAAPLPPRVCLLVGDGPWIAEAVARARRRGVRLLLCLPEPARVAPSVRASADGAWELSALAGEPERDARPDGIRSQRPNGGTLHAPMGSGARPDHGVRLVYYTECLLRAHGWSRLPFRRLAAALAEREEFGPTPRHAALWLNRARAEGLLLVESEPAREEGARPDAGETPLPGAAPARSPRAHPATFCRPNPDHPLVRAAIEIPDRCLRLLHQMLQRIPWVSFKLLRNVLLREQWLGGPPFRLDENGIDEWLNFLIQDGAIRMTKEPNALNPEFPVTALRLNTEHPIAGSVAAEMSESTRLATERAILAVDHFLTRQRKPWMAMSALRRSLSTLGREELQSVLQALQSHGALVTESYPNPQREHHTTGCRLQREAPLVGNVLGMRDAFIRVTHLQQRSRAWVPLARLQEALAAAGAAPENASQCLAWILLLRDEGILELDREGLPLQDVWENVRCRLNLADAVVRAVVADAESPAAAATFRPIRAPGRAPGCGDLPAEAPPAADC